MRITNSMTTNRLLLNINRNATTAERFMMQLSSGKRIQNPSDDPIIASRALRFRTNVADVEQFRRNAQQATSWMEITEESVNNMTRIMTTINTSLVQGATGTYDLGQRHIIAREIRMFFEQMNTEMNTDFAGRYVFSGFRTDRPPIITNNALPAENPLEHTIRVTHDLRAVDLEVLTQSFWRNPANNWEFNAFPNIAGSAHNDLDERIYKFKLPYRTTESRNMGTPTITLRNAAGVVTSTITPTVLSLNGAVNPYTHAQLATPPVAVFIPETGEVILPENLADDVHDAASIDVSYNLNGLYEGELNPFVFFDTEVLVGPSGTPTNPQFLNNARDQELRFELGTNVRIAINSQAGNVYPWQFFADLRSLYDFVTSTEVSPGALPEQEAQEIAFFRESLYQKFTNMLSSMERHRQHTTTEATTLGSRMNRVELIDNRLIENRDTFTDLMSQNENVDYIEVLMRFNAAEMVFQAAMQVGARIAQISIVNFL